jgi:hypothetical protein
MSREKKFLPGDILLETFYEDENSFLKIEYRPDGSVFMHSEVVYFSPSIAKHFKEVLKTCFSYLKGKGFSEVYSYPAEKDMKFSKFFGGVLVGVTENIEGDKYYVFEWEL